jgi:hypothetical protein
LSIDSATPNGFLIRPTTWDDFETALSLIAQQNMQHYGEPMISAETLRDSWLASYFTLATHTWLMLAPNQEMAGCEVSVRKLGAARELSWEQAREIMRAVADLIGLQAAETSKYLHMDIATGRPLDQRLSSQK